MMILRNINPNHIIISLNEWFWPAFIYYMTTQMYSIYQLIVWENPWNKFFYIVNILVGHD